MDDTASPFALAARAVVDGDVDELTGLLDRHPELVGERSAPKPFGNVNRGVYNEVAVMAHSSMMEIAAAFRIRKGAKGGGRRQHYSDGK